MFASRQPHAIDCSYAPAFPPLPPEQPPRLPPHPLSIYCPTVGSPMSWMKEEDVVDEDVFFSTAQGGAARTH